MKYFTLGFLIFYCSSSSFCQEEYNVDFDQFIEEIQHTTKDEGDMKLIFWVPLEYWRIVTKDDDKILPEQIDEIQNDIKDYILIWAYDLSIGPYGSLNFQSEEQIRDSLKIIDENKNEYFPINEDQIDPGALLVALRMKPLFSQSMGEFGRGLHYFFFKVKDSEGRNIIQASMSNDFKVVLRNQEFHWSLPLPSLLPPKYCPIDGVQMKGNWMYCPFHGELLKDQK